MRDQEYSLYKADYPLPVYYGFLNIPLKYHYERQDTWLDGLELIHYDSSYVPGLNIFLLLTSKVFIRKSWCHLGLWGRANHLASSYNEGIWERHLDPGVSSALGPWRVSLFWGTGMTGHKQNYEQLGSMCNLYIPSAFRPQNQGAWS